MRPTAGLGVTVALVCLLALPAVALAGWTRLDVCHRLGTTNHRIVYGHAGWGDSCNGVYLRAASQAPWCVHPWQSRRV